MNHAHLFLLFITLILVWVLGFYTGDHHAKNHECGFWPGGASFFFVIACVVGALSTLVFIIYPLV